MKICEINGACSTHGTDQKCIKILVGNPLVKRQFGRSGRRWEDKSRKDVRQIG
jgi:hypothetical protein